MKNLLILLAFVTCLFITPSFYAQGDYEWVNKGEGRLDNEGLYTDTKGNTYITGTFAGNVKLDSVSLSTGNINKHEIYVAKYSTTGKVIWAKKFSAANLGTESGYSVYADTTGNCYVVGTISVQTVFGSITLTPSGYEDAFIAKLDPSGTVLWAKLGTGPYQIEAFAVTCDNLNNVYVTGRFRFTATFGSFSITAKGTNADIFLVKYDAAGNVLWVKQAGTENGQDIGYATITDSQNNVYITGHFEGSGTFDTVSVNAGVYIAKYDLNGKLIWVRTGGSNISCNFYSIGVDASDNVYTAGNIADGKIIFGNDTLTATKSDMMVCKFKSDGNKIWLRKFEGANEEYATTLRVDPSGNAYIGGYSYSKEIDFGPYHFTSYGDADAFVTKVNDVGDIVWVKQIGGKSQDGGPAGLFHPTNIGIDAAGKVYFKTSISSDPVYIGINKADSVINNGSTLLFKTGMSLSVKKTDNICSSDKNGSIDLTVDGGIPPYTYSWSNGAVTEDIHQLASGIYKVKVTDSKGMISIIQTEIKHPFFESQIIRKNISCNGLSDGTADVLVNGGTPPYSYIWSTLSTNKTLINIGEGSYTVLISDARSCTLHDTVVIEPVLKLAFNTIYNCIDSTKNSIDLSVVQASSDASATYCLPVSQCYFNNHAFRFTLNKYTDTRSECNENAYTFDKDQVIAVLNQDSIHTLDMLSNGSNLGFGVWIDLNKDGDFNDTLEFIYASPTTSMFSNFHTTFKLPSFVSSGKTRLRIRSKVNSTITSTESCSNFSYGYARDYIIKIQGSLSYIWSNGAITEDLSNIVLGTYSVTVKNNSGCTVTDTAIISGPTLFALGDIKNESCKLNDGSIKLNTMGGVPPFLYLWSTLQTSPILTNLSAGTFSVEITDSRGCRANQDYIVKLACSPVWPGDSNNDKTADNNDLLPLGLYFSETGFSRDSVSNTWVGQESTDWLKQQLNGVNLKSADSNGDGIINLNDTLAVHLNYGLTHSKVVPVNTSVPLNPELYFITLKKSYIAGEFIEAEIWAATNVLPLDAIYGLAFKLKLDPAIIDLNTVTLTFSNTWFGSPQNRITFSKILKPEARVDVSLTKIDHKNLNGFGKVASLKFKTTDAIVSPYLLILSFNEYKALDALGNVKAMNTVADSLTILPVTTAIQKHTADFNLTVFPNPYTDFTNIHYDLNAASLVKLEIFNSIGECISQPLNGKQATGAYDYSFSTKALGFAGGIYFIKLTINGNSYFRKMIELK